MPIVLTTNEKIISGHTWKDREGEQYHFPNQYRNKIVSGERFVYYRGVHRADGKRGKMEYFGVGLIGDVWLDPDTEDLNAGNRNWYCSIENYVPFSNPVLAKEGDVSIETVEHGNHWRTAVRSISEEQHQEILTGANLKVAFERVDKTRDTIEEAIVKHSLPALGTVKKAKKKKGAKAASTSGKRYSRKSKTVGDAGERTVLKFLKTYIPGVSELRWLANEGETPGWDIQYLDGAGNLIRVEVKSTESKTLTSIELTANEWRAANKHRSEYQLALVGSCLSKKPIIEFIGDPVGCLNCGELEVAPSRYEISW
jgi:hypothetical protein